MASKGKEFENKLILELQKIEKKEMGFFIRSPTPMRMIKVNNIYKVIYAEKALCDFVGIFMNYMILMELKDISGTRFNIDRLKNHQIKQLSSIKRYGGLSYILFRINSIKEIYIIDINTYLVYINQTNKKSINNKIIMEIGIKLDIKKIDLFFSEEIKNLK